MTSSEENNNPTLTIIVSIGASVAGIVFASHRIRLRQKKKKQEALEQARLDAFYKLENVRSASTGVIGGKGFNSDKPIGTLLTDVTIDEVYLWEVEHLSKHFKSEAPESLINHIHGTGYNSAPLPENTPTFLRALSSISVQGNNDSDFSDNADVRTSKTHYNKLIGVNECILADIVRKPGSKSQSKAFIRAGPRRKLHFNPATVNAAIVTCGGLCPGLNNV